MRSGPRTPVAWPCRRNTSSRRCSPGRRGRSQHPPIQISKPNIEDGVGLIDHLRLEDVVEGRRHADGETAAVVLRPRPRVRDAAQHRGALLGGRRLRWRRGRGGRRLRCRGCGGGGARNGDGGVDGEAAARGAAARKVPPLVRVKRRRRGEREESGGGHGAAPGGGDVPSLDKCWSRGETERWVVLDKRWSQRPAVSL